MTAVTVQRKGTSSCGLVGTLCPEPATGVSAHAIAAKGTVRMPKMGVRIVFMADAFSPFA
jgi:hypothetical protein